MAKYYEYYLLSDSDISRMVQSIIATFYMDIHIDMFYSHTGYVVTNLPVGITKNC